MLIVKNKNSAELTTLCFRRKPESNSRRELLTNKCQKPETKRSSNTKKILKEKQLNQKLIINYLNEFGFKQRKIKESQIMSLEEKKTEECV